MKITNKTKEKVLHLRQEGESYAKIAKKTKISRTSVISIIKDAEPKKESEIDATIYKLCPNPRVIMITLDDPERPLRCVVRAGLNYRAGMSIRVKRVETTDEELYRQV
mgnify:CR=1 FL=1